ncbi:hypothetical protein COY95_00750 [Candidatus Woesearchaeota archaeon CG_4_10_14_0_8_um_filter_47_5]|nr:MAG: hypothetical protein COY95_00750 [Candidatus Woesearchaeota archaeon CG_4_10_14_0_8_um_filter_47_5]
MANPLEITALFEPFSIVFSSLFVFVMVFGVLAATDPFKIGNKGIYAFLAVVTAFMMLGFPKLIDVIRGIVPWFVLIFVFIALLLMVGQFMGLPLDEIRQVLGGAANSGRNIFLWIFIPAIIILVMVIGNVFQQELLPSDQQSGTSGSQTTNPQTPTQGTTPTIVPQLDGPSRVDDRDAFTRTTDNPFDSANQVYGQGTTGTPDYQENVFNTFFNPRVLGLVMILVIAMAAVLTITRI